MRQKECYIVPEILPTEESFIDFLKLLRKACLTLVDPKLPHIKIAPEDTKVYMSNGVVNVECQPLEATYVEVNRPLGSDMVNGKKLQGHMNMISVNNPVAFDVYESLRIGNFLDSMDVAGVAITSRHRRASAAARQFFQPPTAHLGMFSHWLTVLLTELGDYPAEHLR